jgi:hypothetical protein
VLGGDQLVRHRRGNLKRQRFAGDFALVQELGHRIGGGDGRHLVDRDRGRDPATDDRGELDAPVFARYGIADAVVLLGVQRDAERAVVIGPGAGEDLRWSMARPW